MRQILCYLGLFLVLLSHQNIWADNTADEKLFFKIDLKKNVSATTWLYIRNGLVEADKLDADAVIIHMNTYGGEVVFADSIRTKILNFDKPVYVFIDNNAASAGALISVACDKIFMRTGATIGAATVVDQSGQKMPDKYQSYMRATMRATAESHGKDTVVVGRDTTFLWKRDPFIAEAMVDERTVLPFFSDTTKILTFTTEEAMKYRYCEGEVNSLSELIEDGLGIAEYRVERYQISAWDDIKGFLISPIFQGILIMLIMGGIYFELQSPGIGFPLVVAIVAALLYFAPLYIDGLAANWEILLFLIGLILIALELFVVPGFGVAGIGGIILMTSSLVLSLIGNVDFNFENVSSDDTGIATLTVFGGMLAAIILIIYLSSRIGRKGIFRKMALNKSLESADGYVGVDMSEKVLVGVLGIAHTVLRPSGKVKIDGRVYDAISRDGQYIEKGALVEVKLFETGQLYVVEIKNKESE